MVILVAVFVGAASAVVALVTYWLMRERCEGAGTRRRTAVQLVSGGQASSQAASCAVAEFAVPA